MTMLTPDPTFYASPTLATKAPPERFAYLALINPTGTGRPDAKIGRASCRERV